MPDYAHLLRIALSAVADASRVCRLLQENFDRVRTIVKDDRSPVTIGDFAVQAIIARALRADFPSARLVAEESPEFLRRPDHAAHLGATVAAVQEVWPEATDEAVLEAVEVGAVEHGETDAGGGFWTLDPIDGTKGFLRRGAGQYCVCLAYIERGIGGGEPTVAVLGCPNLSRDLNHPFDAPDRHGTIYYAIKGQGVYEVLADDAHVAAGHPRPVHIRRLDHPDDQPVSICESVEGSHSDQVATARILERLGRTRPPARLDSQCKYAVVARGQADAYIRIPTRRGYSERIWDHASGALIASEAGCFVTDIAGRALDFSAGRGLDHNRGIVCAPPRLHGRILGAIEELGLPAV